MTSTFEDALQPYYDEAVARFLIPEDDGISLIDYIIETCDSTGTKFQDYVFPPTDKTLNRIPKDEANMNVPDSEDGISWKRISEFEAGCIYDDDLSPTDVEQGSLGNCWFCCQIAAIATRPEYVLGALYPSEVNQAGVYGLHVCRRGEWFWIIVDDWLPGYFTDDYNSLTFMSSKNPKEFWSSLVEKCFAKVAGSYQGLAAGQSIGLEPIVNLTGNRLFIHCPADPGEMFKWIEFTLAHDEGFVACGTSDASGTDLVQGHGYTVLAAIPGYNEVPNLLLLRNTWGHAGEWSGAYGDDSDELRAHPELLEYIRQYSHPQLGQDDGIFFMPVEDFTRIYGGFRASLPEDHWCDYFDDDEVPEAMRKPMGHDYCYGDDYVEHKGTGQGYAVQTTKIFDEPDIPEGDDIGHMISGTMPQFFVDLAGAARIRIEKVGDGGGLPWGTIWSTDELDPNLARRLDIVSADFYGDEHPEGFVVGVPMCSWVDHEFVPGRYIIALHHAAYTSNNKLKLDVKTSEEVELISIDSFNSRFVEIMVSDGTELENLPQLRFSVGPSDIDGSSDVEIAVFWLDSEFGNQELQMASVYCLEDPTASIDFSQSSYKTDYTYYGSQFLFFKDLPDGDYGIITHWNDHSGDYRTRVHVSTNRKFDLSLSE